MKNEILYVMVCLAKNVLLIPTLLQNAILYWCVCIMQSSVVMHSVMKKGYRSSQHSLACIIETLIMKNGLNEICIQYLFSLRLFLSLVCL